jgi:hypothetical protein
VAGSRQPLGGSAITDSNALLKEPETMKTRMPSFSMMKRPCAWIPLAMSLAALALVLGHAAIFGVIHEADEGTAAHIFQILMAAQIPIVAYFVLRWLPKRPRESLPVIMLQACAWLAAISVVWLT